MIWLSVKKLYEVVLSLSATKAARVMAAASAIKTVCEGKLKLCLNVTVQV